MCGIVFVHQNKELGKATRRAFKIYEAQKKRGTEGYGCIVADNMKITKVERSQLENGIRKIRHEAGNLALFHHRLPTSTPNLEECTHPIFVSNSKLKYDYYVVHNGVISNAKELKTKYEELGFEYNTSVIIRKEYVTKTTTYTDTTETKQFNDSESLAIDLALAIEGDKDGIESKGSIAFVVLQVDKNKDKIQKIFFGRNVRNPLKITSNQKQLLLSSETGDKDVEPQVLFCYDPYSHNITKRDFNIDAYVPVSSPPVSTGLFSGYNKQEIERAKQTKEKKNKEIITSSVRVYVQDGVSELIQFEINHKENILFTGIKWWDADKLLLKEWREYRKLYNNVKEAIDGIKRCKSFGAKHLLSVYKERLSEYQDRLKDLTETITSRPIKKF